MILAIAAALLAAGHPHPSGDDAPPSLSRQKGETAGAASEKGGDGRAEAIEAVVRRYALSGEVLVAKGGKVLLDRGYGTIDPKGGAPHRAGERWRLASITKQVTAALIVKLLSGPHATLDALDKPVATGFDMPQLGKVTLRQLLTHHTGLANPDASPTGAGDVPTFYLGPANLSYCLTKPAVAGAPFAYNNCDYLIAGVALVGDRDDVTGLWPRGLAMAGKDDIGIPGFVAGKPEPRVDLSSYFTAGGLMGTARAVFDFDRSLMTGKLLSPAALAELWKPEGNGSYQALGQWVFPGRLAGCASPKRIVQRDGEIYGVQARNFILPDDDLVVVVFNNRSSDDFKIGEVWEGKGFAYDLLSAAACP